MTYKVTDRNRNEVDRIITDNLDEACIVARVMSRACDEYGSAIYFVEDDSIGRNVIFMFFEGKKFKAED